MEGRLAIGNTPHCFSERKDPPVCLRERKRKCRRKGGGVKRGVARRRVVAGLLHKRAVVEAGWEQ